MRLVRHPPKHRIAASRGTTGFDSTKDTPISNASTRPPKSNQLEPPPDACTTALGSYPSSGLRVVALGPVAPEDPMRSLPD